MQSAIARFLRYMHVERNASDLTIKSYREDLTSLANYLADGAEVSPNPSDVSPAVLRGYVSALHDAGFARSSVSRRLAPCEAFFASLSVKG